MLLRVFLVAVTECGLLSRDRVLVNGVLSNLSVLFPDSLIRMPPHIPPPLPKRNLLPLECPLLGSEWSPLPPPCLPFCSSFHSEGESDVDSELEDRVDGVKSWLSKNKGPSKAASDDGSLKSSR